MEKPDLFMLVAYDKQSGALDSPAQEVCVLQFLWTRCLELVGWCTARLEWSPNSRKEPLSQSFVFCCVPNVRFVSN